MCNLEFRELIEPVLWLLVEGRWEGGGTVLGRSADCTQCLYRQRPATRSVLAEPASRAECGAAQPSPAQQSETTKQDKCEIPGGTAVEKLVQDGLPAPDQVRPTVLAQF